MSTPPLRPENRALPMVRVVKTTAIFVLVAPLIAGVLLFIGYLIEGQGNPRYATPVSMLPAMGLRLIATAYLIGAPYALLTGGAYAVLAVFAGARQFWVAIVTALAPLPFVHLLPALGPGWQWDAFLLRSAIVLATVPSGVCWYLSRRWHGLPQ